MSHWTLPFLAPLFFKKMSSYCELCGVCIVVVVMQNFNVVHKILTLWQIPFILATIVYWVKALTWVWPWPSDNIDRQALASFGCSCFYIIIWATSCKKQCQVGKSSGGSLIWNIVTILQFFFVFTIVLTCLKWSQIKQIIVSQNRTQFKFYDNHNVIIYDLYSFIGSRCQINISS